jgi:hypothetical protein
MPCGRDVSANRDPVEAILRKDRKATAEFVAAHADTYVRQRLIPQVDLVDDLVREVFSPLGKTGEFSLRDSAAALVAG